MTIINYKERLTMNTKLSKSQIEFGEARLDVLAEILDVSTNDLIKVLKDINKVKHFYSWVNADLYLSTKPHKVNINRTV